MGVKVKSPSIVSGTLPNATTCAAVCAASQMAQYAAGSLCPLGTPVELYADDFNGYSIGSDVGNPPWTPFAAAGVGGAPTVSVELLSGVRTVRGQLTLGGVTASGNSWRVFNSGYTGFNNTQCGVYSQVTYAGVTGGKVIGGLCIGCVDAASTNRLCWGFRPNQSNPGLYITNAYASGQTDLSVGAQFGPAVGDVCALLLTRTGAYGWRLEAYINGALVGSTSSASIQLTNSGPKSIGFYFAGDRQPFLSGTHNISFSAWRGGVT